MSSSLTGGKAFFWRQVVFESSFLYDDVYCETFNKGGDNVMKEVFVMKNKKKARNGDKMSTATCIPRRSPIQVLTGLNLA